MPAFFCHLKDGMTGRLNQGRPPTDKNYKPFRKQNFKVGGLAAKIISNELISFVNSFDLVCLTEKFACGDFETTLLKDSQSFIASAKKLKKEQGNKADGRKSGRVLILLRRPKCYVQFVKRIDFRFDNFGVPLMVKGFVIKKKK